MSCNQEIDAVKSEFVMDDWTRKEDFGFWADLAGGDAEAGIFLRQLVADELAGMHTVERHKRKWVVRKRGDWAILCRLSLTRVDRILRMLGSPYKNGERSTGLLDLFHWAKFRNGVGVPVLHISLNWPNLNKNAARVQKEQTREVKI